MDDDNIPVLNKHNRQQYFKIELRPAMAVCNVINIFPRD